MSNDLIADWPPKKGRGRPRKNCQPSKPVQQTGVRVEIRPDHWIVIDGIPANLSSREAQKIANVVEHYRRLMDYARSPVEVRIP